MTFVTRYASSGRARSDLLREIDECDASRLRLALLLVLDAGAFLGHSLPPSRKCPMSSGFHRGGFENATVVHSDRTLLRPVEEADVDLLLEWHADEDIARYWDDKTFTRATMLLRLARDRVTPFVVEAEREPIGYLQVHDLDDDGDGGLDMFLVPAARGRGLGPDAARAMANHVLGERGWTRVTVDPYAWNAAGLRGWRKAGFVDIETHGADDEHVAPWVLMEFSRR
jgi:aminoglycoside 6'-N-acetyltransferase